MHRIIKAIPVALALGAGSAWADNWSNVQLEAVLNAGEPDHYIRLEGAISAAAFNAYGFIDLEPGSNYWEIRINTETLDGFGFKPGIEINGGENLKSIARFGVIRTFTLNQNNYSYVKLSPIELTDSGDEKRSQVGFYTSQDIGRFNLELVLDYNLDNDKAYAEPTLHYRLGKNGTTFLRSRSFGNFDALGAITTLGVRYSF